MPVDASGRRQYGASERGGTELSLSLRTSRRGCVKGGKRRPSPSLIPPEHLSLLLVYSTGASTSATKTRSSSVACAHDCRAVNGVYVTVSQAGASGSSDEPGGLQGALVIGGRTTHEAARAYVRVRITRAPGSPRTGVGTGAGARAAVSRLSRRAAVCRVQGSSEEGASRVARGGRGARVYGCGNVEYCDNLKRRGGPPRRRSP